MADYAKHYVKVDVGGGVMPAVYVHQNDTWRKVYCAVYENHARVQLSGISTKFSAVLPNGHGGYFVQANKQGTIENNYFVCDLSQLNISGHGVGYITLVVRNSSDTTLTYRPVNIKLVVEKSADGADVIANASDFPDTMESITEGWMDENIDDIVADYVDSRIVNIKKVNKRVDFLYQDITELATNMGNYRIAADATINRDGMYTLYYFPLADFDVEYADLYGYVDSFKAVAFYSGVPDDSRYIDGVRWDKGIDIGTDKKRFYIGDIPEGATHITLLNCSNRGIDCQFVGYRNGVIPAIYDRLDHFDDVDADIATLQSETSNLFETIDADDAAFSFGGYIDANGKTHNSAEKWISYAFDATYISKIVSVTAWTNSSTFYNINFYNVVATKVNQLTEENFISSAPRSSPTSSLQSYSNISLPDGCKTVVITHCFGDSPNGMSDLTININRLKYNTSIAKNAAEIENLYTIARGKSTNTFTIYENIWNANDFTFVDDELWLAKTFGSEDGCEIRRYKIIDGVITQQGSRFFTDFGHWNTVDYNPDNDCLVFGNGANDFETEGNWFAVIPHPKELSGTVSIDDVGLRYYVDIGYKVQAVWGDSNLGNNNIVILYANNCTTIVKVLLTKDSNGDFDGNYIVLDSHTNEGSSNEFGSGGGDYWGGNIYIGNGGHHGYAMLNMTDYSLTRVETPFYLDDGTVLRGSTQGMYIDKNYMWMFINTAQGQDTTTTNALIQYYR